MDLIIQLLTCIVHAQSREDFTCGEYETIGYYVYRKGVEIGVKGATGFILYNFTMDEVSRFVDDHFQAKTISAKEAYTLLESIAKNIWT